MTFLNVLGSGINGSQFFMMPSIFSVSSYSLLIFVPYSFFFYFRSRAHMYSLFFNVKLFLSDAPALNNPYSFAFFLTIIPRARMGYESIAHEAESRMGYSLRAYEGERNNCFSKIQLFGQKNIETKHLSQVKG